MAHHGHDHSHDENYFLDQVSTVAVCGLLAGVGFLAHRIGLFRNYNILTDQFNLTVLLGSVALAGLVVVRGVTLWKEAGKRKAHSHAHSHSHEHAHAHGHDHHHHHDHEHGEHCDHHHHDHEHGEHCDHHHDHDHGHTHAHGESCGHDHHHFDDAEQAHQEELYADHGHSHGFAPWRYAVLLLPLMLSGLLLYYSFAGLELRYSTDRLLADLGKTEELVDGDNTYAPKSSSVWAIDFKELPDAANSPAQRSKYEGQLVQISGLFAPMNDNEFTLVRRKMTCCASDSVPIKVRIFQTTGLSRTNLQVGKGAEVTGQAQFRQIKGSDEYVAVIIAKTVEPKELGNDVFIKN